MEQTRRNVVGSAIRRLRSERDLTQEQLAAQCEVAGYPISRGTLAKVEAEIRGATDIEIFVIAKVLGVSLDSLYPPRFAQQLKSGAFFKNTSD